MKEEFYEGCDVYTADELIFAYKDYVKTIKYSRSMSDVFIQILCLYRSDYSAKKDSFIYVSRQIIEIETGLSPDQSTKYINDLIRFGIVDAEIRPNGYTNTYRLKWGKSIINNIVSYRNRFLSVSSHLVDIARDNINKQLN